MLVLGVGGVGFAVRQLGAVTQRGGLTDLDCWASVKEGPGGKLMRLLLLLSGVMIVVDLKGHFPMWSSLCRLCSTQEFL